MAHTSRDKGTDLEKSLLERPDRFSFFQAIRLLQKLSSEKSRPEKAVRIRPDLTFDYPDSEITSIQAPPDKQQYEIFTSFLGLYGVSSPLASYYSEDLIDSELDGDESAKSLFDVLHQRLYELFFQASKKHRLQYRVEEAAGPNFDFLYNLLGISEKDINRGIPNTLRFLRYIDIFNKQPHSALGLQTILEDALDGLSVEVQQCAPRSVKIPEDQRFKLGSLGNRLGVDVVLGKEMMDYSGKIVIAVGPLSGEQFQDLLNNTKKWMVLTFLIQAYLTVPLECELKLVLAENEVRHPQLGIPNWSSLGKDAWLFSGDSCGSVAANLHLDFQTDAKHSEKRPELLLNRIKLFRGFSEEVISKLAQQIQHRHFMPNEIIFEIGEKGDSMYIVIEGLVGVWIRGAGEKMIEVARLGTGSIFGEMALLNQGPRNGTVISISSTYLFKIKQEDIDPIIEAHPEIGIKFREISRSRER